MHATTSRYFTGLNPFLHTVHLFNVKLIFYPKHHPKQEHSASNHHIHYFASSNPKTVILTVRLRQNDLFASYDYIHDT